MAITRRTPISIAVRPGPSPDPRRITNTYPAVESITPGMLIELHPDANGPDGIGWGVHDSANQPAARVVALDQIEMNKLITDVYADGDLVKAWHMDTGDRFYGLVPSGQNVAVGDLLQSNGDGRLKAYSTGPGGFVAASGTGGAVTEDTRLIVEVL